jgi:tRNA(Ile)-lysidine synthase TilS/MesJ
MEATGIVIVICMVATALIAIWAANQAYISECRARGALRAANALHADMVLIGHRADDAATFADELNLRTHARLRDGEEKGDRK